MKPLNALFLSLLLFNFSGFAQAQSRARSIKIEFNEVPSTASIALADLMYNKQFAYSLTIDDGKIDVWNVAFPLLNGFPLISDDVFAGVNYGSGVGLIVPNGYNISDGCGHRVKFELGLAINARFIGFTEKFLNWDQLQQMHDAGWDILNHSYNHEVHPLVPVNTLINFPISMKAAIEGNSDTIQEHIGFYPRHFVVPANSQPILCSFGLTDNCPNLKTHGMLAIYNQNFNWLGHTIPVSEPFPLDFPRIYRNSTPPVMEVEWDDIIEEITLAVEESSTTNAIWLNEFTHAIRKEDGEIPSASNLGFANFKHLMDHLNNLYGENGSDVLWVAGLQTVYEYLYMRDHTSYTATLDGKVLTVYLLFEEAQPDQKNFNLSFNVQADASINNITVDGEGYATKNLMTGLVNVALTEEAVTNNNITKNQLKPIKLLSPNPAKNTITAQFSILESKKMTFVITNHIGQIVQSQTDFFPQGERQIQFDISNLKPGKYLLKAMSKNIAHVVPFVKIN